MRKKWKPFSVSEKGNSMEIKALKEQFEKNRNIRDRALLRFSGVPGMDVYNCSLPFIWEGNRYLFGRTEKHDEWANSRVCLFRETAKDCFALVPEFVPLALEDPFIQKIGEELVLGGTHVQKSAGRVSTYFGYFYRGTSPMNLTYFTTGPVKMKDIRLVPLADGKIGVFSRPRSKESAQIGFTVIDSLDELTADAVANAPLIEGLLEPGQWGGINQAYLLEDGMIGCIGHFCYGEQVSETLRLSVYANSAFVLNPETRAVQEIRIIGTKSCYPECEPKVPKLADCVFTSGLVMREDGFADLYSGVGDVTEGRITIENPFTAHGALKTTLVF